MNISYTITMDNEKDIKLCDNITAMTHNRMGSVSDGYHTFDELYHHRAILTAKLFNAYKHRCWKSKHHYDPEEPMYDGMFIVGIETPEGQATYHYDIDPYWDMFNVKELDRAPSWDGHTPDDAIKRIASLNDNVPEDILEYTEYKEKLEADLNYILSYDDYVKLIRDVFCPTAECIRVLGNRIVTISYLNESALFAIFQVDTIVQGILNRVNEFQKDLKTNFNFNTYDCDTPGDVYLYIDKFERDHGFKLVDYFIEHFITNYNKAN